MKSRLVHIAAMLLLAGAVSVAQAAPTALVGGTIVDGNGGDPVKDGIVLLDGDRIVAAGPRASVSIPANAKRIDVSGKWLTPGLIDAHVHFFQSGGLYTRPDGVDLTKAVPYAEDLARSKARLDDTFARYLASGVTAVVDAGGPLWNFEVRKRAQASSRAPRVAVAGPLIATEPTQPTEKLNLGDPPIISAKDAADARRLAKAQLPYKPDLIKIWGIGSGPEGAKRVEQITKAVADVAHPAGIRVAVHATELAIAQAALAGGADILVHSVDDASVPTDFIRDLKARNVVYVTTAVVYEGYDDALAGRPNLTTMERKLGAPDIIASLYELPEPLIDKFGHFLPPHRTTQILANAKSLVAAGARLAAGTDAGNVGTLHGPSLHRELQLLSQGGLTPAQVLTAATRDAAFAFSPRPDIGLIKPGYRADLLVLDADPLKDIANLMQITTVWSRGVPLNPRTLLPPTPESVVQLQLERYNAHDIEGFLATYADDAEIFDTIGDAKPGMSGKAELRKVYAAMFANMPGLHCRSAQRIVEGDFIIDQEICFAQPDKRPLQAAAIYQVVDGKIRRAWFAAPAP